MCGRGERLNSGQQSGERVNADFTVSVRCGVAIADLAVSVVANDVVCRFSGVRGEHRCGVANANVTVSSSWPAMWGRELWPAMWRFSRV